MKDPGGLSALIAPLRCPFFSLCVCGCEPDCLASLKWPLHGLDEPVWRSLPIQNLKFDLFLSNSLI